MSKSLEQSWYSGGVLPKVLLPLSWLFGGISATRRQWLKSRSKNNQLPVPVIVVGNISVGGTGKTPLLITLLDALRQAGYRPGVVSRGYGGKAPKYPLRVESSTPVEHSGDEPLMIARQSGCPVVVDPDRLRAARFLLVDTECNIVLSDDGLQHYRLPRDIELAVVDGQRGFGNGYLLPAGPLREPVSRLSSVDAVLVNGVFNGMGSSPEFGEKAVAMKVVARPLLRSLNGKPSIALRDWQFTRRKVHAVAGIGNPQRFIDTLTGYGFQPELHAFPDHHQFVASDLCFDDDRAVIMTAKDAVKCESISREDCWVLDVAAELPDSWLMEFLEKVKVISDKKSVRC
ncbi:tetraacyldisaccharide 4'-kinase [Porticoccaceae bacterium LTM1]|nr:tetraacyldisaccharide 4'-kinase [Porticoccaceae bacterium LTM1]